VGPGSLEPFQTLQNLIEVKYRHAQFFLEARLRDELEPVAHSHFTPAYPFAVLGSRVLLLATRLHTPAVAVGRILENEADNGISSRDYMIPFASVTSVGLLTACPWFGRLTTNGFSSVRPDPST
jgi:hypothetical protein